MEVPQIEIADIILSLQDPQKENVPKLNSRELILLKSKTERILKKSLKLIKISGWCSIEENSLNCKLKEIMKPIESNKIMKKTINQMVAAVITYLLKSMKIDIKPSEVIKLVTENENSKAFSKETKPKFSRNDPRTLSVSKLTNLIESRNDAPVTTAKQSEKTKEIAYQFAKQFHLPKESVDELEKISTYFDHHQLGSRSPKTLAASTILYLKNSARMDLTLTRISEVSEVSACTIRKAHKDLVELIQKEKK